MEENTSLFSLSIDPATRAHLSETAKWARFLAILGFIFLVLLMAAGVYTSLVLSRFGELDEGMGMRNRGFMNSLGLGLAFTYIVIGIIAFFPLLFMLRFANQMRAALNMNDQVLLTTAFQNLKVYFRYLGIITIIGLVLMLLSWLIQVANVAVS